MRFSAAAIFHSLKLAWAVPFIILMTTTNSAFAATSIPFTINMSEAVNITGTPRIAVDVGGISRYATYSAGTGTATLTFTYSMVAGDVDLDGITISSPMDLNGGTVKDLAGNDLSSLTFTVPNTTGVKVNYPSLGMDFIYDADGRYTLNGTAYNDLSSFLTAAGGSFARASIGTYYDSAGTLETAASGVPRFDFDPVTHASKGILIEESRTNLLTRSEELDNAIYTKTGTSVTPNIMTAPDGMMTADKLVEGAAGTFHNTIYTVSLAQNISRTVSVYAKAGERNWLRLQADDNASNSAYANFDLTSGTAGTASFGGAATVSSSITSVGNGWYKCMMTYTLTSATTTRIIYALRLGDGTGTSSYSGDGTSGMYLWGGQVEQGAFATSYIPTTTATVTRNTDVLTVPTGTWYNTTEGTLNVDAFNGVQSNTVGIVAIDRAASAGQNRITLIRVSSTNIEALVSVGGTTQYQTSIAGNGNNALNKVSMGYKTNNFRQALNNSLGALDASGGIPTIDTLRLGAWGGSTANVYNGWIQKFKYYPARTSDTQLQLLTQ